MTNATWVEIVYGQFYEGDGTGNLGNTLSIAIPASDLTAPRIGAERLLSSGVGLYRAFIRIPITAPPDISESLDASFLLNASGILPGPIIRATPVIQETLEATFTFNRTGILDGVGDRLYFVINAPVYTTTMSFQYSLINNLNPVIQETLEATFTFDRTGIYGCAVHSLEIQETLEATFTFDRTGILDGTGVIINV